MYCGWTHSQVGITEVRELIILLAQTSYRLLLQRVTFGCTREKDRLASSLAQPVFLERSTHPLDSCRSSESMRTTVVVHNDLQRGRKYSGERQKGLTHADKAVFAQGAPLRRIVPKPVLCAAVLRDAAWVDHTSTDIAAPLTS